MEEFEFQISDGSNYFISDAQICLEPCNINGGKTSWIDAQDACQVSSDYRNDMFNNEGYMEPFILGHWRKSSEL